MNLREQAEAGLALTLEDPEGFGLPVLLTDPDGNETGPYYGQIIYNTYVTDEVGQEVVLKRPIVTLRTSSLARVPLPTEKNRWAVKIPITPSRTANKVTFLLGHPSEDGGSIGFIRLYLTSMVQE